MSNPWAQSFDDLRRPYLEEKKDRDGDGKVESDSKEHAGLVHNAIQRAKGGKPDGKDTRKEAFTMAADPEKRAIPRPTKKAEDKKGKSLKSRAIKTKKLVFLVRRRKRLSSLVITKVPFTLPGLK